MYFGFGLKHCKKCGHRHGSDRCCVDIYQQLGHSQGPSVTGKILLAFVLPMLIFVGSLAVAQFLLSKVITESRHQTLFAFLVALAVTVVAIQFIRVVSRKSITTES